MVGRPSWQSCAQTGGDCKAVWEDCAADGSGRGYGGQTEVRNGEVSGERCRMLFSFYVLNNRDFLCFTELSVEDILEIEKGLLQTV